MAAQGHWFGLKMILINYISNYYISNDFSMNSFKFSPSLDPLDLDFGPEYVQKCLKIIIFFQKKAAQAPWFRIKRIKTDLDRFY